MRVAYACADPGLPVFGRKGASVHVQEIIRSLVRAGHDVVLFATRMGGEVPPGLDSVEVHPLATIGTGGLADRERRAQAVGEDLAEALARHGPFDLVYERYSLWSASAMAWARRHGVPSVLEVNAPLVDEQATHRGLVDRRGAESYARACFGAATAVIAVSEPVAAWVRAHGGHRQHVHVVANGVDPNRIIPASPARGAGTFTVGFIGTLKPWHGLDTLIDAAAQLGAHPFGFRLLLVGDGPQRRAVEERVARRGLTPVTTFTGSVDPSDMPSQLHGIDVAVAPYPDIADFYFSPLKLYEYLAAGLAVVASDVGQIAEVIDDGHTGVLYPAGDAAALARAIADLRDDPARRVALGSAARTQAVAHHSWDGVLSRTLSLAGMVSTPGPA